ncbi:MAG: MFS transporter [Clostridiales Family XIII bacterium]|jgi:predicted MFS family arabinose efflux permease|nr:MFS transporter [Clostridiales Family XIII bacterium]
MKNRAWPITIVIFLSSITLAIGCFKIAAIMTDILAELNVDIGAGGWLASMIVVAGIILAIPGGGIMMKIGPKKMGISVLACAFAGNVVGAMAPNFMVLIAFRLVEGVGFSLLGIFAPAIIGILFPPEKRGVPMAIWSTWVSIGILIIFNLTNVIVPNFGWRGDYWFTAILVLIMLILFAAVVKLPEPDKSANPGKPDPPLASMGKELKNPAAWLLALTSGANSFATGCLTNFEPTFLIQTTGMDPAAANMASSVVTIGMIISGIVTGFILNKLKRREYMLIVAMVLGAVFMFLNFNVSTPEILYVFLFITGFVYSMAPPTIFTIAPETAITPVTIGMCMGILSLLQCTCTFLGSGVIGQLVQNFGGNWGIAPIPMLVMGIVGIVASLLYALVMRKRVASDNGIESPLSNA